MFLNISRITLNNTSLPISSIKMSYKRTLGAALIGALVATPLATVSSDAQSQETIQTQQESLETLVGPLAETAPQLKLETIQSACQITNERRTAEKPLRSQLRNEYFYTSDTSVYTVEDGEVFLYFGNGVVTPVLKNVGVAADELANKGYYVPKQRDVESVLNAEDTLKVKLSDLRLKGNWKQVRYLEIETDNYNKLNKTERALAESVYCQGKDFIDNMEMLNNLHITKAKIYIRDPEYFKERFTDQAIAWASWLDGSSDSSVFVADGWRVDIHSGLRGVKLEQKQ